MAKQPSKQILKSEYQPFEVVAINSTSPIYKVAWCTNKILNIDFEFTKQVNIFDGFEHLTPISCYKSCNDDQLFEFFLFKSNHLPIKISKDLKHADYILYYQGLEANYHAHAISKKLQKVVDFSLIFIPNKLHFQNLSIENEQPVSHPIRRQIVKSKFQNDV